MAQKITAMTAAGTLTGEEIVPVVRSGDTDNFRTTTQDIANLAPSTEPPVTSVNELTGAVVLDTDDIAEGASNLYLTQARLRTAVESSSDTTYDFVLADAESKFKMLTSGSAMSATIPPQASVAWPDNAYIELCQGGTGAVTITPGSGVTVAVNPALTLETNGQYAVIGLKKVGTNSWIVFGNLVPA